MRGLEVYSTSARFSNHIWSVMICDGMFSTTIGNKRLIVRWQAWKNTLEMADKTSPERWIDTYVHRFKRLPTMELTWEKK